MISRSKKHKIQLVVCADLNLKKRKIPVYIGSQDEWRRRKGGESFGTVPSLHQICSSAARTTSITSRKSSLWLYIRSRRTAEQRTWSSKRVPTRHGMLLPLLCSRRQRSFGSLELPTTTNQTAILMIISCLRFNELPMMERAHSQLVSPESSAGEGGYDSAAFRINISADMSFFLHYSFLCF